MESLGISKQTLQEFLDAPFGIPNKQKQLKYESRYLAYKKANKIKIESSIEYEKNYFVHLKVPSESQRGDSSYDVVIQFFTPDEKIRREVSVKHYYVQFFSNSPGFMYKYASLYKLEGYLIEALYDKFADGMLDVLPDKANSKYELYFDSSIYYACRYLLDNKSTVLTKFSLKIFKTKPPEIFFRDIQDTESVALSKDVSNLHREIKKEIERDTKLSLEQKTSIKRKNRFIGKQVVDNDRKKQATKSTSTRDSSITVKTPKHSTTTVNTFKKIHGKTKKVASKTTVKK